MRRPLVLLAAALLASVSPLPADEVPHLDFVRALRGRNSPDLALDYLERIRAGAPPDVAALIPLEAAKVRLDLANAESDSGRRLALYHKARAEFQEFVAANPASPLVAEARLEIARVAALQAKTQLGQALRQDTTAAAEKDALTARQMFLDAGQQLASVAAQLDTQLADPKYADPKTPQLRKEKHTLEQARLQAELDLGLNLIDQAHTYINEEKDEVLRQRAEIIKKALPVLERLSLRDGRNPVCWVARAWVGHAYDQNGDPKQARLKLQEVLDQTDPAALPGKRLARYFRLLLDKAPEPTDATRLAAIRTEAERWLKDYPNFVSTPEGFGVRYLLAQAHFELGQAAKDNATRAQHFNVARRHCRELERVENDFTEKARGVVIRIVQAEGGFDKEIARLPTFEDCVVRAQYEVYKINELARKKEAKPEDVEKERAARVANAIESLKRALELARKGAGVSPAEVGRARYLLTGYYLFTGKPREAIETGEELAIARPPTGQSAAIAVYVLQAHSALIAANEADGVPLADQETEVKKLRDLAEYMERTWPSEPAGDLARHQLGIQLLREKKPAEAVEALARVSPAYADVIFARYQLAMAAFQAAQDRAPLRDHPDKGRREKAAAEEKAFEEKALEALRTLPPLPGGADGRTTAYYLQAKVELGRGLYKAKQYAEIEKVIDPLLAALDKGDYQFDSDAVRDESRANLAMLRLYAKYGQADAELKAGKPDKVKEIVDPVVEAIRKGEHPELKRNPTLRWGLMGLALRVHIQEGNTARAQEVLQALQKFAAEDEGEGGSRAILQRLAQMVEERVREVRRAKDKELLARTVASFGAFLDELAKQQKDPSPEFLRLMAEAYAGLERHGKAVELARAVPEPKGEAGQPPDARLLGNYRFCRLLVVRELRLDGKLDEAEAALKEVRETPWGKNNIEAEKEGIHLIAARGQPARAYAQWRDKVVNPSVSKLNQPGVKEQYFEGYYHMTECYLKYALNLDAGPKRDEGVNRAATFIKRLEEKWPNLGGEDSKARFADLLEREPALKEQYDKLKSGT
jgi:hypothetical protein